jgi:hypothetical protein
MKIFNKIKFSPFYYYFVLIPICVFAFNALHNKHGGSSGSMVVFVGLIETVIKCFYVVLCLTFFHLKWIDENQNVFISFYSLTICLLLIDIILLLTSNK